MDPNVYIKLLWRGRGLIVGGAFACALIALITAILVPRTYEAKLTVLVSPPTFKAGIAEPPHAVGYSPRALATLMPPPFPVETYQALAQSPNMLKEVSDSLQMDPDSLTELIDRCNVGLVQLGSRTAQFGTSYSEALVFSARANDPDDAAKIVHAWATLFIGRVDTLTGDLTDRTVDLVKTMYDASKERLDESEQRYEAFQKEWNLTLLETEKTALETLVSELEVDLQQTEITITTTSKLLDKSREQLASKDRIDSLFQAPSADAYWITKQAAESGQKAKRIGPEDGLRTEIYNPEYQTIKTAEITAEQELSQATAKKEELTARIEAVRQQVQKLQEDLAAQRPIDSALQRDVKTHGDTYDLASKSRDYAQFADANRNSDLLIVSKATAPGQPADVSRSMRVILGFILGAMLSAAYILARQYIAQVTGPEPTA